MRIPVRSILLSLLLTLGAAASATAEDFLACSGPQPANFPESLWNDEARAILHELGGHDLSAFFGFTPQISFHVSTERNAYAAYPYEVVLTTGLIESCYNRAELAFVIAHELGHLYKRHASGSALVNDRTIASDQRLEVEADRFAAELLDGAQYGRLAGRLVLARLAALEGTRTGENQSLLEERLALLSK